MLWCEHCYRRGVGVGGGGADLRSIGLALSVVNMILPFPSALCFFSH